MAGLQIAPNCIKYLINVFFTHDIYVLIQHFFITKFKSHFVTRVNIIS